MPTPAQIDEQIQLERDAIAQGLKKLHKTMRLLVCMELLLLTLCCPLWWHVLKQLPLA